MGEKVSLVFFEDTSELPNNNIFCFNDAGNGNYKLDPIGMSARSDLCHTKHRLCCLVDPTDAKIINMFRDNIRTYEKDENGLLVIRIAKRPYVKKRNSI